MKFAQQHIVLHFYDLEDCSISSSLSPFLCLNLGIQWDARVTVSQTQIFIISQNENGKNSYEIELCNYCF